MANQLSPEKRRVSYAEWVDVFTHIEELAKMRRRTPTDVIREATLTYISALNEGEKRVLANRLKKLKVETVFVLNK